MTPCVDCARGVPGHRELPSVLGRMAAMALGVFLAGITSTNAASDAPESKPSPGDVEQRIYALVREIDAAKQAGALTEIPAILRRMTALDPEHPKTYIQAVLFESEQGKIQDAPALMDSLGLKDGPGRRYGDALMAAIQRRPDEARGGFEEALERYTSLGHIAGQAACHTMFGNLARPKDPDKALDEFETASTLLERIGDRHGFGDVLNNMADVQLGRGQAPSALATYRRAAALREEIGDRRGEARSHHGIGLSLLAMGDKDGAVKSFRRALAIRESVRDRNGVIATLEQIGAVHDSSREWDAALRVRRRAVRLSEEIPDKTQQAVAQRRLGETLRKAERRRDAVAPFETAVRLFRETGNRSSEARASAYLGSVLHELGELHRARTVLEPALEPAREAKDRQAEAEILAILGNLARVNRDLTRALVLQNDALTICREVKDQKGVLANLNNLGAIELAIGNLGRARQYAEDALGTAKEANDRAAQAVARNNLGIILAEEGRLDGALEEMRRSIEIKQTLPDTRSLARGRADAAEVLMRLGKRGDALKELLPALSGFRAAGDLAGEAYALNLSGEIRLGQGNIQGALTDHERALALARSAELPGERWRAHFGLGAVHEARGRKPDALREYGLALDEIEKVRTGLGTGEFRMRFLAGKISLYERALAATLPPRRPSAGSPAVSSGFRIAERARARSLLDRLAAAPGIPRELSDDLRRRRTEALDDLAQGLTRLASTKGEESRKAAQRRVEGARDRLDRMEIEIQKASAGKGRFLEARPVGLEEVQGTILRQGEVLLEYFVGTDRAWVWRIERDRAAIYPLPPPSEIASLVSTFLDAIDRSGRLQEGRDQDRDAAGALAAAILPPDPLPSGARLIVVPDGPLHHVPFEALRRDGRFILEGNEVTIVPSATALGIMRRRTGPPSKGFLGVADPVLTGGQQKLGPLLFARQEVESLAGLFAEPDRVILAGKDATRTKVMSLHLEAFRYLHFATHGWLDPGDLDESGLWLSPSSDGPPELLSVDDILSLDLDSDLVVLSACRSGIGEELSGEGLVGLTRGFLHAGSRAVVVSLWDVADQTTADLMRDFYRGIVGGKPASTALREAKLRFLTSEIPGRGRILRWAPFVLVGDPGR